MCMFNKKPWRKHLAKPKRMWKIFQLHPSGRLYAPIMGMEQPSNVWLTAQMDRWNNGGFHVFRFKWLAKRFMELPPKTSTEVVLPVLVQGKVYGVGLTGIAVEKMFIPEPPPSLAFRWSDQHQDNSPVPSQT